MSKRNFSTTTEIILLAAVYFCAAKLGLSLAYLNASASAVWPPTGIALAVLLLRGYRLWPGVFLGSLIANWLTAGTLITSLAIASGNTLETLVGAWLVNRLAKGTVVFERTETIFSYVFFAAIFSTAISATIGVATLAHAGFVPWEKHSAVWMTWWLGDLVSDFNVAPVLLIWFGKPRPKFDRKNTFEFVAVMASVALVGGFVFGDWLPNAIKTYPLRFLSIPPLVWAAYRFHQPGASAATLLMSLIAIYDTVHGLGPFAMLDRNQSLLLLQAFMGTISLTGLFLAALLSERQHAEESLRQSDAFKGAILQSSLDGLVTMNHEGKIMEFNPVAEQIFGYHHAEVMGKEMAELIIPPALREQHRKGLAHYLRIGEGPLLGKRIEISAMHSDGRIFPVELAITRIDAPGAPVFTASIRDITARKESEEALQKAKTQLSTYASELETQVAERTAALRETVSELEGFCYSIAHDLRAPLRAVQGLTTSLLEDHARVFDPAAHDCAQRIVTAVARMDNLILDLLDYGQLTHAELPRTEVNLETQITQILAQLADEIKTKNACVEVVKPLPSILANAVVLERVIANLVSNALKFTKPGQAPRLEICAETNNGKIRLWIKDDGIGIAPEYHQRIFQVFQRLHAGDVYPGTGIGLAIAQKGIERMGGKIGLESEPEKGSKFWIEFPKSG